MKAGLLCGTNPVSTRANAGEAYEALKKIDFLAVIDFFLTPTAELADIFLPAGTWLEQNHVADNWKRHGYVIARQKAVEIGECWQEHGLGVGPRLVRVIEKAPAFIPVYCHHCAKAPCKEACPVDAIFRNDQGIVLIDNDRCIGCKECMGACPFGAMQFDDNQEIAIKCDLCVERLTNNEAPACSKACATGCIIWGNTTHLSEHLAKAI